MRLRHTTSTESKHWLGGFEIKYWPQQLNFAIFCATQGCVISREIFDNGINLPQQIRYFYIFHMYFMVRHILYQVGGIDSTFNRLNLLHIEQTALSSALTHQAIFHFTRGANHSLGSVNIHADAEYQDITNSVMKVGKQSKETLFITSRLATLQTLEQTGLPPTQPLV